MAKKETFTGKDVAALEKLLVEKREDLRKLRFTAAGGRHKDAAEAKKARKDIARILTARTVQKAAQGIA